MRKKCNEVGEDIEKEHLLAISRMLKDPKTRCYNVLSGLPASVEKKESAFIACRFSKKDGITFSRMQSRPMSKNINGNVPRTR